MSEKEIKEKERAIDNYIHQDRLKKEAIFQFLIKQSCLEDVKVCDLKDIADSVQVLLSNIEHNLKENKGTYSVISDTLANTDYFITDVLMEKYAGKKKDG